MDSGEDLASLLIEIAQQKRHFPLRECAFGLSAAVIAAFVGEAVVRGAIPLPPSFIQTMPTMVAVALAAKVGPYAKWVAVVSLVGAEAVAVPPAGWAFGISYVPWLLEYTSCLSAIAILSGSPPSPNLIINKGVCLAKRVRSVFYRYAGSGEPIEIVVGEHNDIIKKLAAE
jgi:hypothetical protein